MTRDIGVRITFSEKSLKLVEGEDACLREVEDKKNVLFMHNSNDYFCSGNNVTIIKSDLKHKPRQE